MNHDHDHPDQAELEQATARSLPLGAALSAGRAAERDGFLALGDALEQTAGTLDEAALLARLESRIGEEPATVAPTRPRGADTTWQAALSVALAAAALFALARIAVQSPAVPRPASPLVAQQEPSHSSQVNDATGAESVPSETAAWRDPLDEELAFAQAAFEVLNAGEAGVDGSLSRMNIRLEALSQELYGGSL